VIRGNDDADPAQRPDDATPSAAEHVPPRHHAPTRRNGVLRDDSGMMGGLMDVRTSPRPAAAPAPDSSRHPGLRRLVVSLPDRVPVVLMVVGVVCLLAILANVFEPVVVVPASIVGVTALWRFGPEPLRVTRSAVVSSALVLAFALVWIVVNVKYASEYVVVNRDPGFLTLQAIWLRTHHVSQIPVGSAAGVMNAVSAAHAGMDAFDLRNGVLYAQGNKMLPGLLAAEGWIGGVRAILAGNLLIGGAGIVTVFAAARRLVGDWWALLPAIALAGSLPFLAFTRAGYTEPLAMVFTLAGVTAALSALRSLRRSQFLLTGALLGTAATSRIDGTLGVLAVFAAIGVVAFVTVDARTRAALRAGLLWTASLAIPLALLGIWDVREKSPVYLAEQQTNVASLLALTLLALAIALTATIGAPFVRLRLLVDRHRLGIGRAVAIVFALTMAVLVSRPWWLVERNLRAGSSVVSDMAHLQASLGLPVDPQRSYDELSLSWIAWYFGWTVVVLGIVGLVLMARRAIADRDPRLGAFTAFVMVGSMYYLIRVNITPDQIWAVRRLVPLTIPGFLIASAWVLSLVRIGTRPARAVLVAALTVAVAVFPVLTWNGLAGRVELRGRYEQAMSACTALDHAGVHHVVWIHSSPFHYLATLRVICDVDVVEFVSPPTEAQLAEVRAAWGAAPVAVMTFDVGMVPWTTPPAAPVETTVSTEMARRLTGRPTSVVWTTSALWFGMLTEVGTVTPSP